MYAVCYLMYIMWIVLEWRMWHIYNAHKTNVFWGKSSFRFGIIINASFWCLWLFNEESLWCPKVKWLILSSSANIACALGASATLACSHWNHSASPSVCSAKQLESHRTDFSWNFVSESSAKLCGHSDFGYSEQKYRTPYWKIIWWAYTNNYIISNDIHNADTNGWLFWASSPGTQL